MSQHGQLEIHSLNHVRFQSQICTLSLINKFRRIFYNFFEKEKQHFQAGTIFEHLFDCRTFHQSIMHVHPDRVNKSVIKLQVPIILNKLPDQFLKPFQHVMNARLLYSVQRELLTGHDLDRNPKKLTGRSFIVFFLPYPVPVDLEVNHSDKLHRKVEFKIIVSEHEHKKFVEFFLSGRSKENIYSQQRFQSCASTA